MKILALLIVVMISTADAAEDFIVSFPAGKEQIIAHPIGTIVGKFTVGTVTQIQLLQSYRSRVNVDVFAKEGKARFIVDLRSIFPDDVFITQLITKTSWAGGKEKKKTYSFDMKQEIDIKKFWTSSAFQEILGEINESKIFYAEVVIIGWRSKTVNVSTRSYSLRFNDSYSFSVPLNLGSNIFFLRAFTKQGAVVAFDSVRYYRTSEISGNTDPGNLTKELFHRKPTEGSCTPCHQTLFQKLSKDNSVEKECKPCHVPITRLANVHAPAGSWDCLMCHDPNAEKKYSLYSEYSSQACFDCHSEKKSDGETKQSVHAVLDQCNLCHDAHGADNSMFLNAPVNTICLTCHEDIAQKPHPVVNHPIDGRPDPFRSGKEMSCITCHNPHASDHPKLLVSPQMSLCQDCHKK